ncbi:STAS domain-containing protein [Streptomyces beigongshangae]|uniref:STAS domain-containing protein n=1 Tax=Streptomyces beigongshangae TaxID=2841597 RepID=UPI001C853F34|nr:STAS domain-containing protein [Streptomyces sp. REN17]
MTEPAHLTVTPSHATEGVFLLSVTGELDYHTSSLLTDAVNEAPFADENVIIDLSGLTYCDSTGITVLITAYNRSRATESQLSLTGVNPDQMRVFELIGLDQVFTFHSTPEEAVSAMRS